MNFGLATPPNPLSRTWDTSVHLCVSGVASGTVVAFAERLPCLGAVSNSAPLGSPRLTGRRRGVLGATPGTYKVQGAAAAHGLAGLPAAGDGALRAHPPRSLRASAAAARRRHAQGCALLLPLSPSPPLFLSPSPSGPVQLLRGVVTHKGALSLSPSLLLSISPAHAPLGRSFGRGS